MTALPKAAPPEMRWFAWQRAAGGGLVPVAFDEHPKETPSAAVYLVPKSIRPIPLELRAATLAELATWAGAEDAR